MDIRPFGLSKMEGEHSKTSYRCCVMRKVLRTELAAGGRFSFYSGLWLQRSLSYRPRLAIRGIFILLIGSKVLSDSLLSVACRMSAGLALLSWISAMRRHLL